MASEYGDLSVEQSSIQLKNIHHKKSGYCSDTGVYHSPYQLSAIHRIPTHPNLGITRFILSQFPKPDRAETQIALIDSSTGRKLSYAEVLRSVKSLAAALHHALGVCSGDVVLLLSPNSIVYPIICLAVLSIGAILTTVNPLYTAAEIAKQIEDSGAKLAISAPEDVPKLQPTKLPTLVTNRRASDDPNWISIEELLEGAEPSDAPSIRINQSDTAALLYSSGTTGICKGVILTHGNLMAILTLLKWTVHVTSAQTDIYLAFLPMFHVYGLAFFALGLFCVGSTIVVMPRFDFHAMLDAIQRYKITNIPTVPPIILALVRNSAGGNCGLSSMRRVSSGAAALSKELIDAFRLRFPWIELRQGYGLTESSGAATFFVSEKEARSRPGSVGALLPEFCAKVVDIGSGVALPPHRVGELWLKSGTVMKGYLRNEEATIGAIDSEGWLRTGDLCFFDGDGFLYIVDRIKELIKHNGYQVAPAELEAVLLAHPQILDAAVIPVEDEEVGQIPVAYVVKAANSLVTENQIIQFVASQVAPYKKIKKASFIDAIPRSTAGKILRKQLVTLSQNEKPISKL